MTIAACYLSPEGVVLGADSTTSLFGPGGHHFFDFSQKLFEIGESSSLGILTWGLGGLGSLSYRTLVAELADDLLTAPPTSVSDVVARWGARFFAAYQQFPPYQAFQALHAKQAYGTGAPNARTASEEADYSSLRDTSYVGFCIAGNLPPVRSPEAYVLEFDFSSPGPSVRRITSTVEWWGAPFFFSRLMNGVDPRVAGTILASGKWAGTPEELREALYSTRLELPVLPIRDAADYVHACIYSTIKAMKFSSLSQVCGGPVEIAVITTDRRFRWVRHKSWDAAIKDGFA